MLVLRFLYLPPKGKSLNKNTSSKCNISLRCFFALHTPGRQRQIQSFRLKLLRTYENCYFPAKFYNLNEKVHLDVDQLTIFFKIRTS